MKKTTKMINIQKKKKYTKKRETETKIFPLKASLAAKVPKQMKKHNIKKNSLRNHRSDPNVTQNKMFI